MTDPQLNENELLIERYAYKEFRQEKEKVITLTTKAAEINLTIYNGKISGVRLDNREEKVYKKDFAELSDTGELSDTWWLKRACEHTAAVIFSGCAVPSTYFETPGKTVDFQKCVKRMECFDKTSVSNRKWIGWVDHNVACVLAFDPQGEINKVSVYHQGSLYLNVDNQGKIKVAPAHKQDIRHVPLRHKSPLSCFMEQFAPRKKQSARS